MNGVSLPDRRGVVPGASLVGSPQPPGTKVFPGPSLLRRPPGPPGVLFPFPPLPAGDLGDSQGRRGEGASDVGPRGEKEKRPLQVLQDRCDNPQSVGRVGGERQEPGWENGKLEWGLLQRSRAPPVFYPTPRLSRLPPPGEPRHIPAPARRISWGYCSCLKKKKKSLSEQARCNFLSFVKAASCFPSFIAL